MKEVFNVVLIMIVGFVLTWLMVAFVVFDLNPKNWSQFCITEYVITSITLSFVWFLVYKSSK